MSEKREAVCKIALLLFGRSEKKELCICVDLHLIKEQKGANGFL